MNQLEVLVGGSTTGLVLAKGPVLKLREPLSFWGGVDPATGIITQPRHEGFQLSIVGTVLILPGTIGSSSGSAILLELLRIGKAPVAIVLEKTDAILTIGAIVAREMSYGTITMACGPINNLPDSGYLQINIDGSVRQE
jgi:predicted aconitase with swiveling domain